MRVWLFVLALLIAAPLSAKFWYTAPGVTVGTGGGTIGSPWALQDALVKNSKIQAGDTLYLRGGTYTFAVGTNLLVGLTGAISNRIVVDAYPGEHPVLDLKNTRYGMFFTTSPLASGAQYVDFRTSNSPTRERLGAAAGHLR